MPDLAMTSQVPTELDAARAGAPCRGGLGLLTSSTAVTSCSPATSCSVRGMACAHCRRVCVSAPLGSQTCAQCASVSGTKQPHHICAAVQSTVTSRAKNHEVRCAQHGLSSCLLAL